MNNVIMVVPVTALSKIFVQGFVMGTVITFMTVSLVRSYRREKS